MSKGPKIPNPADAAVAGIQADTELQPFQYLINSAATLGQPITIDGKNYDFTGLGQADTTAKISDQMAQTLLDLQRENSPQIIAQRLAELKAADPQGYAARQQLFDRILADAQRSPGRPVSTDLQKTLQDELAKGSGFSDAKQAEQVREGVRGHQSRSGIYLGAAPASEEAKTMVNAGESLQSQRQQNALNLLQSGASPEDVAYRELQQNLANLGAFQTGETPQAQFRQVSSSANGPVSLVGGASPTNTFNPNAAGQGISNAMSNWNSQFQYNQNQANPWLAGLSLATNTVGSLANINPSWFGGGSTPAQPAPWTAPGQSPQEVTNAWLGG
jgi:hypothetical protein